MNAIEPLTAEDKLRQGLRALSSRSPLRLRILELLSKTTLNVKALTEYLSAPQPSVSRHLKTLRDAGIIDYQPGYRREHRYFIVDRAVEVVLNVLAERLNISA